MPDTNPPKQPPGTSGYPEPQPTPKRGPGKMPNENTPHESQNVPERKPDQPKQAGMAGCAHPSTSALRACAQGDRMPYDRSP